MTSHSIYIDEATTLHPGELVIAGDEAHHAVRVKRIAAGDQVRVLDGRGHVGQATVTATGKHRGEWMVTLRVEAVQEAPRTRPRLEVLSAVPKGSRLSDMVDGLSQVGAASWAPLQTRRAEVDPRPAKIERLDRTALEACKQCGRPWRLEIGAEASLAAAVAGAEAHVILADASGAPYARSSSPVIRLLVGPEGGWTPDELSAARGAGAQVTRFGAHIMRIETAAIVASGIILATESDQHRP